MRVCAFCLAVFAATDEIRNINLGKAIMSKNNIIRLTANFDSVRGAINIIPRRNVEECTILSEITIRSLDKSGVHVVTKAELIKSLEQLKNSRLKNESLVHKS